MPKKNHNFMTRKEAADYLGISELTLLHMIWDGAVEAFKVHNRWLVQREALDNYIRRNLTRPESQQAQLSPQKTHSLARSS